MKLSYIILTESGERLNMNQANEYQPNEFCWVNPNDSGRDYGLIYQPNDCTGFVFTTDPNDPEPAMAVTVPCKGYTADGVLLFNNADSVPFWL